MKKLAGFVLAVGALWANKASADARRVPGRIQLTTDVVYLHDADILRLWPSTRATLSGAFRVTNRLAVRGFATRWNKDDGSHSFKGNELGVAVPFYFIGSAFRGAYVEAGLGAMSRTEPAGEALHTYVAIGYMHTFAHRLAIGLSVGLADVPHLMYSDSEVFRGMSPTANLQVGYTFP